MEELDSYRIVDSVGDVQATGRFVSDEEAAAWAADRGRLQRWRASSRCADGGYWGLVFLPRG